MTIRYYILPLERNGDYRGPKYFAWRFDPDPPGLTDPFSCKDYGSLDLAVAVSDISDASHTALSAHTDVYSFPVNIDATLTAQERSALSSYLEASGVPGDWVSPGDTFRVALRTVSGMMFYMQRLTALTNNVSPLDWGYTLNTQWRNIAAEHQAAIAGAAQSLGYSTSFIGSTTQIRAILKNFSEQWGNQPILFGLATL